MCVIIDACVRDVMFPEQRSPPDEAAALVVKWIEEGGGRMVYGGSKYCEELFTQKRNNERIPLDRVTRRVRAWKQAGRALEFPNAAVDEEIKTVNAMNVALSNDVHVVALARVSGARVLFSFDSNLHADFKNAAIVNSPRGTIYQTTAHAGNLQHGSSCRAAKNKLIKGLI